MKIGTRGSKLALIQAQKVVDLIKAKNPEITVEIEVIQTSGDWKPSHGETLLSEADGGKGLFAKEIEMALLDGRIDMGVHSMKDVPTFLPQGLSISHYLDRDDPRDAFISEKAKTVHDLPQGAVVGTSSLRRQALLLSMRPDLQIVPLRGNVDTRLQKLRDGQVDATILAASGLDRMKLQDVVSSYFEPDEMLPAVCQGIIGIEIRENDAETAAVLDTIHNEISGLIATAERAVLEVLDGSCRTPIGSFAQLDDDNMMRLRGLVASENGMEIYSAEDSATIETIEQAYALGVKVGQAIKSQTPDKYLQHHA